MGKRFKEHACEFKNESKCEEELDEDAIDYFDEETDEFGDE